MSRDEEEEKKLNGKKLIVVVKCLIEELISELTFFLFVRYWVDILIIEKCKKKPSTLEQRVKRRANSEEEEGG